MQLATIGVAIRLARCPAAPAYCVAVMRWSCLLVIVLATCTSTGQLRYRAITAANHEFVAANGVPPCHRAGWRGPYDADATVLVADRLPIPETTGTR
ncbi:MAG: hypothetical protein U0587_01550 [Candidatus Binatia bacterium]